MSDWLTEDSVNFNVTLEPKAERTARTGTGNGHRGRPKTVVLPFSVVEAMQNVQPFSITVPGAKAARSLLTAVRSTAKGLETPRGINVDSIKLQDGTKLKERDLALNERSNEKAPGKYAHETEPLVLTFVTTSAPKGKKEITDDNVDLAAILSSV